MKSTPTAPAFNHWQVSAAYPICIIKLTIPINFGIFVLNKCIPAILLSDISSNIADCDFLEFTNDLVRADENNDIRNAVLSYASKWKINIIQYYIAAMWIGIKLIWELSYILNNALILCFQSALMPSLRSVMPSLRSVMPSLRSVMPSLGSVMPSYGNMRPSVMLAAMSSLLIELRRWNWFREVMYG